MLLRGKSGQIEAQIVEAMEEHAARVSPRAFFGVCHSLSFHKCVVVV